ncbi:DUF3137 domain-containing protein [bacterium]|nr:DUF3137 domain-containing protein [bacterium]
MEDDNHIKDLFDNELKTRLQALETVRKQVMKPVWATLGVLGVFFILAKMLNMFRLLGTTQAATIITWLVILGIFIVAVVISGKRYRVYRKLFKEQVVAEILKLYNKDWKYAYDRFIDRDVYFGSELFRQRVDRYKGDDLIGGKIGKTDFEFSELHTQYKTVSYDSKGNRREQWHTIFKGLFFHADFNKHIKGKTFVLPDTAESLFGSLGKHLQAMNKSRGTLVKMEDPAFEKKFVVYGLDQIEPRYILTPKIMQNLTRLRETMKRPVYLSFLGSRVYVAVSFGKALFEPRLFSSGVRLEDMEEMYGLFALVESIVAEMDLNTRIWTKE